MTRDFQYEDKSWSENDWRVLMESLIEQNLVTWKDVTTLTLGQMNPSQVGTSLASSEGFKQRYGKGNTMKKVMDWFYSQDGTCISCGTRVDQQVDHIIPKETFQRVGVELNERQQNVGSDERQHIIAEAIKTELVRNKDRGKVEEGFIHRRAAEADRVLEKNLSLLELRKQLAFVADHVDNLGIRCRRCNVIRRPSHRYGGSTYQTAESALMWLLLYFRPRTRRDYIRMCRLYGMTMSDIRMAEGWAMAHWLQHLDHANYEIDDSNRLCSILKWPEDSAITRAWLEDEVTGATVLYEDVLPMKDLCIIVAMPRDTKHEVFVLRQRVEDLPFSHYFKDSDQPPQALAVTYSAPSRSDESLDEVLIGPLPPRDMHLIAHKIVQRDSAIRAVVSSVTGKSYSKELRSRSARAKLCNYDGAPSSLVGDIFVQEDLEQ